MNIDYELFGKIFVTVVVILMYVGAIFYAFGGKYGTALFWFFVASANLSIVYFIPRWG